MLWSPLLVLCALKSGKVEACVFVSFELYHRILPLCRAENGTSLGLNNRSLYTDVAFLHVWCKQSFYNAPGASVRVISIVINVGTCVWDHAHYITSLTITQDKQFDSKSVPFRLHILLENKTSLE